MPLVGIVGRKGVGKDACADYACERLGYIKRAFADPVKEGCVVLFQLEASQLDGDNKEVVDPRWGLSPRQMMQILGTDLFRKHVAPDFWIRRFLGWYAEHGDDAVGVVVPDVRFQNEVDLIKSLGGRVVRITRSSHNGGEGRCTLEDTHESETGVASLEGIDCEIDNSGTEQDLFSCFEEAVKTF